MLSSLQHRTVFPFIIIIMMIITIIFIRIKPLLQKTVITIRVTILTVMPTWTLAVKMNNKIKKECQNKKKQTKKLMRELVCPVRCQSSIFGESSFVAQLEPDPKHPTPKGGGGPPLLRLQHAPEWSAAGQQERGAVEQTEPHNHLSPTLTSSSQSHTHAPLTWILWVCGSSVCVCFFVLLDSMFLQVWLYRCIGLRGTSWHMPTVNRRWRVKGKDEVRAAGGRGGEGGRVEKREEWNPNLTTRWEVKRGDDRWQWMLDVCAENAGT